jgi:hypothetical protein
MGHFPCQVFDGIVPGMDGYVSEVGRQKACASLPSDGSGVRRTPLAWGHRAQPTAIGHRCER